MRLFKKWPDQDARVAALIWLAAMIMLSIAVAFVLIFSIESWRFFQQISWRQLLFETRWAPRLHHPHFGIWPLIGGTCLTAATAMLVALPFGLLSGIYLSQFAKPAHKHVLKPMVELLAAIPSVVYGFFAVRFVTPFLQQFVPDLAAFNALSPGLVMGMMIIPLVASLSEVAISAVPSALRDGAYALGASRLRSLFCITLPSAKSGILSAVTLAMARATGETLIVAMAAGQQPRLTLDPRVPIQTMTAYLVQVSTGDAASGTVAYQTLFVVGSVLFLMTLVFNLVGFRLAKRVRRTL